jgi:predicted MFS family arabinose efflux permease
VTSETAQPNTRSFEWWMVSNLAIGAGFSAFVALLIPPYVIEVTGSAAEAGVIMAVMSLAAVLGPIIGSFADRYRAHRLIMSSGIFAMAFAFVAFALAAETSTYFAIDAIVMGIGVAAVSAVGPEYIVGAKLDKKIEASQLTVYNLIAPVGQVLGGALLGAAAAAGLSYSGRFWISAVVMALAGILAWLSSGRATKRLHDALYAEDAEESSNETQEAVQKARTTSLRSVLFSTFGIYLLVLIASSIANNGINNQIANILPNVYGINEATTSALISLAGLLNIAVFFLAGWWMGRGGMIGPFTAGHVARLVGALGLAVFGLMTGNAPLIMVAVSMQLLYQGLPFVRLSQPVGAIRFSSISAGQASGWVIGASAIGSFLGSVLGGWLADKVGFNAINWMGAAAAGVAVALTVVALLPADRRKRKEA